MRTETRGEPCFPCQHVALPEATWDGKALLRTHSCTAAWSHLEGFPLALEAFSVYRGQFDLL